LPKARALSRCGEYDEWKEKFEAGYGHLRDGVTPEEVEVEIAAIPEGMRRTYIAEKYIGKGDKNE